MRGAIWLSLASLVACAESPPPETPADANASDPAPIVEVLPTEDRDGAEAETIEPTSEEAEAAPEPLDTSGSGIDGLPPICEIYLVVLDRCLLQLAHWPEVREPMELARKAQVEAFRAANSPEARAALKDGCEMSLKAIRDNPACNEPAP